MSECNEVSGSRRRKVDSSRARMLAASLLTSELTIGRLVLERLSGNSGEDVERQVTWGYSLENKVNFYCGGCIGITVSDIPHGRLVLLNSLLAEVIWKFPSVED